MNDSVFQQSFVCPRFFSLSIVCVLFFILLFQISLRAQNQFSVSPDQEILTVDDAPDLDVIAFGKKVIVKQRCKTVLVLGGDAIIEGKVEEETAVIGGSIIQKQDGYIGGDVFVFGGSYRPENVSPLRGTEKQTVVIGIFEDELRDIMQNPSKLFSPSLTKAFLAQRVLSVLFWFLISLGLTTLAPGAVSRAAAAIRLSALKIFAIGIFGFLVTTLTVIVSLKFLPNYLGATFGLMALFLLMLAYVFGRVALQVSLGKWLQKKIFGDRKQSETWAILMGVLIWTVFLSIPYFWTFSLMALFAAGIGLILTARTAQTASKM